MHAVFAEAIISWFKANARPLPWRTDYAPYHVWISEIMLQQTQMERGCSYFSKWIEELPDITAVANADEDKILKLWEGLGYYSRARNLKRAAEVIVRDHGGQLPQTEQALAKLPGIGPYTTAAILSIAFNKDAPLVDANVARVFSRVFDIDAPIADATTKKRLWELAEQALPSGKARLFNQGVMEFGALVCTKTPSCGQCPITTICEAYRLGITDHRPVPGKKQDITPITIATGVLIKNGKVYIQRRRDKDVWGGLWEFPGGTVEQGEEPEQTVVREFHEETGFEVTPLKYVRVIKHGYTRFRVTLHCYTLTACSELGASSLTAATQCKWVTPRELADYAFPAGHRKLIDFMTDQGLWPTNAP